MNIILMFLFLVTIFLIAGVWFVLAFTRSGKNLVIQYTKNRKYVICHMNSTHTDFVEIFKVVPEKDFLTSVGRGVYNLNPNYSALTWKGRQHFIIDEADVIPKYTKRSGTNEEILIQVKETTTALENRAYTILYGKYKDIAFILACVGLLIAAVAAIYASYEISQVSALIQQQTPRTMGK